MLLVEPNSSLECLQAGDEHASEIGYSCDTIEWDSLTQEVPLTPPHAGPSPQLKPICPIASAHTHALAVVQN